MELAITGLQVVFVTAREHETVKDFSCRLILDLTQLNSFENEDELKANLAESILNGKIKIIPIP